MPDEKIKGVVPSAVTLIQGLTQHLRDAAARNDPGTVEALADQLRQQADALAAAVPANQDPEDIAPQPPAQPPTPTVEPPIDLSPVQIPLPPVE